MLSNSFETKILMMFNNGAEKIWVGSGRNSFQIPRNATRKTFYYMWRLEIYFDIFFETFICCNFFPPADQQHLDFNIKYNVYNAD